MKKLIVIFVLLSLTLGVFGQHQGVFGRITDEPEYELLGYTFDADDLNAYVYVETNNNINMLYSFVNNDRLYLLSYDEATTDYRTTALGQTKQRELWLFMWDGNEWSKASTQPLQVDWKMRDKNGTQSHDLYYPWKDKNGLVEILNNGDVHMRITRHTLDTYENHVQSRSNLYWVWVILTPTGRNMYHVNVRAVQR